MSLFLVLFLFAVPYGACSLNDSHCFGRLPGGLVEGDSELLAIDSAGNIYRYFSLLHLAKKN